METVFERESHEIRVFEHAATLDELFQSVPQGVPVEAGVFFLVGIEVLFKSIRLCLRKVLPLLVISVPRGTVTALQFSLSAAPTRFVVLDAFQFEAVATTMLAVYILNLQAQPTQVIVTLRIMHVSAYPVSC